MMHSGSPGSGPGNAEPFDPRAGLADVETSTEHFLATAARLHDASVRAPSLLPGWTRGHVLAHVARNADSLVNLLTWARTGVETPQYVSLEARDAAIEAGAGRPAAEHLTDLRDTAARFVEAVRAVPDDRWDARVRWRSGEERPARAIIAARLREVEIHHVDVALDYTPAHWHIEFSGRVLDTATATMGARGDVPSLRLHAVDTDRTWTMGAGSGSTAVFAAAESSGEAEPSRPAGPGSTSVSGPQAALLAWLIGRSSGDGLIVEPHGAPLPVPPPWA